MRYYNNLVYGSYFVSNMVEVTAVYYTPSAIGKGVNPRHHYLIIIISQ